jgi:hypothetical protein
MKHRTFVKFVLKKRWGKIHKVFIGKDKLKYSREIREWCEALDCQWYRADGYETYYFNDPDAAFHFMIRFGGQLFHPPVATSATA